MAEDVIIQGFGDDRNFPDFATEATQKQLLSVMSAAGLKGLKSSDLEKLISKIGNGDSDISSILKSIKDGDESNSDKLSAKITETNKKITELRQGGAAAEKARDADAEDTKKILGEFSGLMTNIREGLQNGELGIGESAGLLGEALGELGGPAKRAAQVIVGLASAVAGANQYFIGIGEDRFNLANEIRQSGLATSLSTAESGMVNFSEMVNRTSFSLGQAAEFANSFSMAVGGAGIERSMQFVEDMAYGGAEGADMMRRFGLEFGGVANVAGQYLESVRSLGMLDRMNNQDLRGGMEDFMETVTTASNIMKINIQDAAEMIAKTLSQRDDLTVMLAGLPDELRQRVTGIVGAMGAQGTQFGESIALALSSMNFEEFLTTAQGQALAGSNLGQEFLPLLRSVTDQIRAGANEGDVLASMEGPLRAIVDQFGESGFRELIAQNQDPMIQALGADFIRILDTIGDADAGNRADTNQPGLEDDRAFVDRNMVQQEFLTAQENVMNTLARATDYAENLSQRNQDQLRLINTFEENAVGLGDAVGGTIADITFGAESFVTNIGASIGEFVSEVGAFVSEDFAVARRLVQEQNKRAQEMLNMDPESIEREAAAEEESVRAEIQDRNLQLTVGDADEVARINQENGTMYRPPSREEFSEDTVLSAINLGHKVQDYETTNDAGETIIEKRINTRINPMDNSQSYMAITDAQLAVILGEREIKTDMRESAGEGEFLQVNDRFSRMVLENLTSNTRSPEEIGEIIAHQMGIDDRNKTFDLEGDVRSQQELAFVTQAIEDLQNNASLSQEQVNQIVTAIGGITTDDYWFNNAENTLRETGEKNALVGALSALVRELQSN